MPINFEGVENMPSTAEYENNRVDFLELESLGAGNRGLFGPVSERELEAVKDCTKEEYIGPESRDSHCMDDGFEGGACQLPGNRAITEIGGEYMDPAAQARPLSVVLPRKVDELVAIDRMPWFHGDDKHGKAGCAALKLLCSADALRYNSEHKEVVAGLVYTRLRRVGVDTIESSEIIKAIETGAERADDAKLWDLSPEEAFDLAAHTGAETEMFQRKHRVAGSREDVSPHSFLNGRFRAEHTSEDRHPLGMLSITYGLYLEQLKQDGFSQDEIARKLMQSGLFTIGILKLASHHELPAAIVG
jgi:hypothetical protein